MELVRLIQPDGVISKDVYTQESDVVDSRGRVIITDSQKISIPVHKQRVVPDSAYGKAVVLTKNNRLVGICPHCRVQSEPNNNKLTCPTHGVFEIISEVAIPNGKPKAASPKPSKKQKPPKEGKAVSEVKAPVKKTPIEVDFAEIMKYGELWTKDKQKFDHANVDLQSHCLIGVEPLRKLCFNTYNGTLGKKIKDPMQELDLDTFKNGKDGKYAQNTHVLKDLTVEALREQLEKSGYVKR